MIALTKRREELTTRKTAPKGAATPQAKPAKPRKAKRSVSYDATPVDITAHQYGSLQMAYSFLNEALFAGQLPNVLISLQRKANTRGYFSPDRFSGRGNDSAAVHELALNPDSFESRTDKEIAGTLAHEMAHVWQQTKGTPPRRCYHSQEWADKMKEIGLQPTDTGEPGGKETGQRVTHIIVSGGAFEKAFYLLAASGFRLNWQSAEQPKASKKAASKTKYTCEQCGQNAWAKPSSLLICGSCHDDTKEDPEYMGEETK